MEDLSVDVNDRIVPLEHQHLRVPLGHRCHQLDQTSVTLTARRSRRTVMEQNFGVESGHLREDLPSTCVGLFVKVKPFLALQDQSADRLAGDTQISRENDSCRDQLTARPRLVDEDVSRHEHPLATSTPTSTGK
ncbi:hypothetical protein [Sciscionella sediminilitoris]|uniref:hypothetical protein n=1 Tax=Sciscionella sediminilitoris TaxID=1445613 RepID=UPI0012E26203|nr:hypothetical protein [Sciscionella sp. SE31]